MLKFFAYYRGMATLALGLMSAYFMYSDPMMSESKIGRVVSGYSMNGLIKTHTVLVTEVGSFNVIGSLLITKGDLLVLDPLRGGGFKLCDQLYKPCLPLE